MTYVYDIVLNFNEEYYEFYEWNKDDVINHIKRINLIKVDSKEYNKIYDNIVSFSDDFMLSIFNKCEYFSNKKIESIPYAFLLTDSYRVMGIMLDKSGKIIKYSSLLLDDEEDVLDLCYKIKEEDINYKIIKKSKRNEYKTRQEKSIIKYIKKDLKMNYERNNLNKLKYLYYEYFNKQCDDIKEIYQELIDELDKNIGKKQLNLFNLIKLSYSKKSV